MLVSFFLEEASRDGKGQIKTVKGHSELGGLKRKVDIRHTEQLHQRSQSSSSRQQRAMVAS